MQANLSIVIICKNEADNIERAIGSARGLVRDIVVYDSGSTDNTIEMVEAMGLPVHRGEWLGFGPTRRAATLLAQNDWVFCLDADELLSESLVQELDALRLEPGCAWEVQLRNHLGKRYIRWGAWRNDFRLRLFHRRECNWNDNLIHEKVVPLQPVTIRRLQGGIWHRTARDIRDYRGKMENYARLTAEMYFRKGKRAGLLQRLFSPLLTFVKSYFGKLGFLEGMTGLRLSLATASYTRRKYQYLKSMSQR
ncbi:MAG: glycosyltransferase family 2 protein [Chitinophagaceae bacterium]|nr:MAG: glycosyltransferase family 2 protein [Chitinophagaceae bacterium]